MAWQAILATICVSLISLSGILILSSIKKGRSWVHSIVGLAIGTLLGIVFFDLMPETIEQFSNARDAFKIILASILAFFVIEKLIHCHHCSCEDGSLGHRKTHIIVNNLIGDGLHNFVDGTLIASAFLVNFNLGVGTTIAVALHEIPQEVSDFYILVYSGLTKFKAILYNFIFGLTSVFGAILIFVIADEVRQIVPIILCIASGNFIYLAMADLVPELHHENSLRRVLEQLVLVFFGIALMYIVGIVFDQ